jgi:hypothetical protein
MKLWMAWLWTLPACVSVVGISLGIVTGDQTLIGKSLLVFAGTLSVSRIGAVATFPI